VQVIDSGIDGAHPDLQGNRWLNPGTATSGNRSDKEGSGDDQECNDGIDNDNNGFIDDCWGFNHADDHGGLDLMGSNRYSKQPLLYLYLVAPAVVAGNRGDDDLDRGDGRFINSSLNHVIRKFITS